MIDFSDIHNRSIPHIEQILDSLKVEHKSAGKQLKFINPLRDDTNFGSASINTETGIFKDFAIDGCGGDLIAFVSYIKKMKPAKAAEYLESLLQRIENDQNRLVEVTTIMSAEVPQVVTSKEKSKTTLIIPIPPNAPPLPKIHRVLGEPEYEHLYHNSLGQLLCYILRYKKTADGSKPCLPYTLRRNEHGQLFWKNEGLPAPRPLYNLHLLTQRPNAPVLIVEGEKSADAAALLFPEYVIMTTTNGSQSPEQSDLSPLLDREILIWRDYDEPGQQYEDKLIDLLRLQDGKASITIMQPITYSAAYDLSRNPMLEPGFEPSVGWDAADALEIGYTAEHIKLLPADTFVEFTIEQNGTLVDAIALEDQEVVMPSSIVKFLARFHPHGLNYISGSFYGYKDGYWPNLDIAAVITKQIARYYGAGAEKKIIDNHMVLLKAFLAQLNEDIAPNLNLICLANGTLDTSTGKLISHSPDHNLRTKTDIAWDSEATCPQWLRFLDQIFTNDADKTEKIAFMKMWFGYCLVPDNTQHKFVWMVGSGGNGKSLLLSILTRLAGDGNVSHAYMERLKEKVVRAELEDKLINISPEMSADATISDGYLKSIVAGDIIEAERKYKPSFSFKPYVRLIAATNHLPRLLDTSDGFFRRAIVLSFNRQFLGAECDPELENKLVTELPGIFAWAVEGLKELRVSGQFVIPPSSVQALAQYKAESDPVGIFATECLTKVETGGLQPSEIYSGYSEWCSKSGFSRMNKVRFGKRLSELGFAKRRSGGKDYWLALPIEGNGFVFGYVMEFKENIVPFIIPSEIDAQYKL